MAMNPRLLRPTANDSPASIPGLALWLDASAPDALYTTDAGPVTAVSSPLDLSGCVLWLDGADLSSLKQNSDGTGAVAAGDPIGYWRDKSASAAHVTGSSTARPTLTSAAFNGYAAPVFNGSTTNLSRSGYTAMNNLSGATFIAVCANTVNQVANLSRIFGAGVQGFWLNGGRRFYIGDTTAYTAFGGSNILAAGLYSFRYASSAVEHYDGGANVAGTVLNGPMAATTGTTASPALHVGSNIGANAFWTGPIAEYILFNRALTRAELASVEAYLAAKWGISGVHAPAVTASQPVGYWRDRSGTGLTAVTADATKRPMVATVNGRRALDFDGVDDTLTMQGYTAENGLTGLTRFAVAFLDASAGTILLSLTDSGVNYRGGARFIDSQSGNVQFSAGSSGFTIGSVNVANTGYTLLRDAPHVLGSTYDGTKATLEQAILAHYDGATLTPTSTSGAVYSPLVSGGTRLHIGSNVNANNWWNGKICEYLVYNRVLTAAQRRKVERYLARRWGITLAPQVSNAEAQDWVNRVYTNGGTVSQSTASAVSTFCDAIEAAGIRDRFYRLGIFAGDNLNAALVPLYRGPTFGGTTYGNATDTNNGPFVSGDYVETGASGGISNATRTKHLNTGFLTDTLSAGNRHLSAYARTWPNATFDDFIGSEGPAIIQNQFVLGHQNNGDKVSFAFGSNTARISSDVISSGANWLGVESSLASGVLYRNGVSAATGTLTSASPPSASIFVFAFNRASTPAAADLFGGTLGSYSIGLSMTATQAADYNTAIQAFHTALGRNV